MKGISLTPVSNSLLAKDSWSSPEHADLKARGCLDYAEPNNFTFNFKQRQMWTEPGAFREEQYQLLRIAGSARNAATLVIRAKLQDASAVSPSKWNCWVPWCKNHQLTHKFQPALWVYLQRLGRENFSRGTVKALSPAVKDTAASTSWKSWPSQPSFRTDVGLLVDE